MKSTRHLATGVSLLALAAMATLSTSTLASSHRQLIPLKPLGHVGSYVPPHVDPYLTPGTWTDLTHAFPGAGPDTSLLLTDGTVLMHDYCTSNWWKLTPDNTGSYDNGTWSAVTAMPAGYGPALFASEILPDGKMIVSGGLSNNSGSGCDTPYTTLGALYDPTVGVGGTWTSVSVTGVAPPWTTIGNAASVILPIGSYMLANCCNVQEAITTNDGLTWTATGTGKADSNIEEGWTNLPTPFPTLGEILTVDASLGSGSCTGGANPVELYHAVGIQAGTWTDAGCTFSALVGPLFNIGPAVLRPDGIVVYFGATGNINLANALISPPTWTAGPSFTGGFDVAEGPAALMPNGNIMVQASLGYSRDALHAVPGPVGSQFFVFKYSNNTLHPVPGPASAPHITSSEGRFLVLPTGQLLWSNDGQTGYPEVATYTPGGTFHAGWRPVVTSVATTLVEPSTGNPISGKKFNGWSQGATYGDDAQESTNYPIVRIRNNSTGHVCFGRSYNFSSMGVWTAGTTNAVFDLPGPCDTGASLLQVIVNGIPSKGTRVTVTS